ncbi:hypothetical protein [Marinicella sp. W31]|uniref:hypothetical protein n=1 Tax=Marinicella sp. W31 TaxID=3023713 RepID=UPI00375690C2
MKIKKHLLTMGAVSAFCCAGLLTANAEEAFDQEAFDLALKALPELAEDLKNPVATKAAPRMKCYVDTPAFDLFTYGYCFSVGNARTTTAVFRVDNVPAGAQILWSNSNCTNNQSTCFVPIRQYQTISVTATVLNPNGTFNQTSATAEYEGFF